MTSKEIFARFRLSIDNGFRNEFSYVWYRRWGTMELWEGGRFSGADARDSIEIWFNWNLIGRYRSYGEARSVVTATLKHAPASLHDLASYLEM